MQAPAGPDGSVALKMHPSMPPRRGLSEAVLSREAAAWARHFLELEKARPAEEVVSVAEAVAKEVAGALGKEVVLDLGGSAAADGATDDAIKVAVAAGLRIGEPTVKELVMILSVPEGSGTKDALDSVVERFEERDVALAVLSRSDYSADCIVRVPKEPEIAEPAYAEGERPGDPVMLVKLFAAGSPRAYVHSCFYRSVPAGKTIQLMTKMKLRGSYVWDGAAGLLRQPNGEPMQAETEAEVLKILNLDGEELFRPSSGS
ncbi:hypothetical protein DFJ74DRAFT_679948 [Hyaloraphidium curvatum]|nr:hypothetical protein DFJ74DRAFT_679948 [Hyaloraphidium curvatum]